MSNIEQRLSAMCEELRSTSDDLRAIRRVGREIARDARKVADGSGWTRVRYSASSLVAGLVASSLLSTLLNQRWWLAVAFGAVLPVMVFWWVAEWRGWGRRYEAEAERLRAERLPHLFGRGDS